MPATARPARRHGAASLLLLLLLLAFPRALTATPCLNTSGTMAWRRIARKE